jgi:hypothetical protein
MNYPQAGGTRPITFSGKASSNILTIRDIFNHTEWAELPASYWYMALNQDKAKRFDTIPIYLD